MSAIPILPAFDVNDVKAHFDLFVDYHSRLGEMIDLVREQHEEAELEQEFEETKDFSAFEWDTFSNDKRNWAVHEQDSDHDDADYSNLCSFRQDCYYAGHPSRRGHCQIFRLKGTDACFVCDACLENGCHERKDKLEHYPLKKRRRSSCSKGRKNT